jgi:hypothetical protein
VSGGVSALERGAGLASRAPRSRRGTFAYYVDRASAFRYQPSETLVVSGFWRSGTTWLEEALRDVLHAKTLFEPLCELAREVEPVHVRAGVAGKSMEFLRLFMPYCGAQSLDGPLHDAFRMSLRSESWGSWLRRFRKDLSESLRPRIVVKFVRAQLCLRAAQNTFGMPVLHVYRDPRAIIASIRKTRWHWLFDHLTLQGQLLDPQDGRAGYFGRWRDEILDYDRQEPVARVAAYWALSEKFLQDSYADHPRRFVCIAYEDLVHGRERIFAETLDRLELRPWRSDFHVSQQDSTTTSQKQRGASVAERVAGWRKVLSSTEVEQIEAIVRRFGFEDRLASEKAERTGPQPRVQGAPG